MRELKNVIESMVVTDSDGVLDVDDLTEDLQAISTTAPAERSGGPITCSASARRDRAALHHRDPQAHSGNREEAARMLGIGERTLYRKLKEYGAG